ISSRRLHTRSKRDWSSDVCSSDLHDTIGFCTALIELGFVEKVDPITRINIDTPAGLVKTETKIEDGEVKEVSFKNVPSFYLKTVNIEHATLGKIFIDISYGGNFYG